MPQHSNPSRRCNSRLAVFDASMPPTITKSHEKARNMAEIINLRMARKAKARSEAEKQAYGWDYLYEPDAATVIDELLTRYIEALVYQAVAENMASEQSARMVAMKAATDNAGNVIGELKLVHSK
mgnify:CR=1 FL=1